MRKKRLLEALRLAINIQQFSMQRRSTPLPPSSELHSPISTATTSAPYFETQIHQIPSIHFLTHCFHFDEVVAIAEDILYTLVNAVVATTDSAVTANGTSNNAALRYRIEERSLHHPLRILTAFITIRHHLFRPCFFHKLRRWRWQWCGGCCFLLESNSVIWTLSLRKMNLALRLLPSELTCPTSEDTQYANVNLLLCKPSARVSCFIKKDDVQQSSNYHKKSVNISCQLMHSHLEESFQRKKKLQVPLPLQKPDLVRTLLIDNYDSYTYNIYQELSVVNGVPPVVIQNDDWTWEELSHYLYEENAFDNIVISPGPGSPACPQDIGENMGVFVEFPLCIYLLLRKMQQKNKLLWNMHDFVILDEYVILSLGATSSFP
ncbi:hypothetical protein PIB30_039858 [Stylosanthes scabra]|uniref:Glutamine amidotransferase domain-containing protein n=1 Tax=Stylosanthes scabra TaxID=79078 RepID=A0ABU6UD53_9FABA|nr:hypothetical protein [Stylosanthes scabra]